MSELNKRVLPHLDRIAELFFENHLRRIRPNGKPARAVAISSSAVLRQINAETKAGLKREDVDAAIVYLHETNRIHVTVSVDKNAENSPSSLSKELSDKLNKTLASYGVRHWHVVNGVRLGGDADSFSQTRVMRELGEAAGKFLSDQIALRIKLSPTDSTFNICVGAGQAVESAMEHVFFDSNFSADKEINIIPFTGLLGWKRVGPSPLSNSRRLESKIGGTAALHWYCTPAVIEREIDDKELSFPGYDAEILCQSLKSLRMVRSLDELRANSDVYIFSVTGEPKLDDWKGDRYKLISKEIDFFEHPQYADSLDKVAGLISGLAFDKDGEELTNLPWISMGTTLQDLERAAARDANRLSVLIVGGDRARSRAVTALIKSRRINALFTDVEIARNIASML